MRLVLLEILVGSLTYDTCSQHEIRDLRGLSRDLYPLLKRCWVRGKSAVRRVSWKFNASRKFALGQIRQSQSAAVL